MNIDACYHLGYVTKTHGTKGQVNAFFDVDFPEEYNELESVFLEIKGQLIPFFIEKIEPTTQGNFIIKFEDINTLAEAENIKGKQLYLPEEKLPDLQEGQFYYHEVEGFLVVDKNLGELGTVKEFYELPMQDVMCMTYKETEVLVPVREEFILSADKNSKKLFVELPEGLLEVYTKPEGEEEKEEEEEL